MNKLILTICVLIFFVNCSGNLESSRWDHFPIKIQQISDDDIEIINTYNEIIGVQVFELVQDPNIADCLVEETEGKIIRHGNQYLGYVDLTYSSNYIESCVLNLSIELEGPTRISIYAHEIGHVLNAPHFSTGIMISETPPMYIDELTENIEGELLDWILSNYSDLLTASE